MILNAIVHHRLYGHFDIDDVGQDRPDTHLLQPPISALPHPPGQDNLAILDAFKHALVLLRAMPAVSSAARVIMVLVPVGLFRLKFPVTGLVSHFPIADQVALNRHDHILRRPAEMGTDLESIIRNCGYFFHTCFSFLMAQARSK
jgi:hypothetical protein